MNSYRLGILACFCFSLVTLCLTGCVQQPAESTPKTEAIAPLISSLTAANTQVSALSETQIACEANGGEGDNLTYVWTATGGTFIGSGSVVSWKAPATPGSYTITVSVSNGFGSTKTENINITVTPKPSNPPIISSITFSNPPYPPITINSNMTDTEKQELPKLTIRNYTTADISCVASDPDNTKLDYTWHATGGKLEGTGAKVQWIAAGEPGTYTITVNVSDTTGGVAESSIQVVVHCCSG